MWAKYWLKWVCLGQSLTEMHEWPFDPGVLTYWHILFNFSWLSWILRSSCQVSTWSNDLKCKFWWSKVFNKRIMKQTNQLFMVKCSLGTMNFQWKKKDHEMALWPGGGWSYIFRTLSSIPFFPDKSRYHRIFTLSGLFRTCQAPDSAAEVDPIAHFWWLWAGEHA